MKTFRGLVGASGQLFPPGRQQLDAGDSLPPVGNVTAGTPGISATSAPGQSFMSSPRPQPTRQKVSPTSSHLPLTPSTICKVPDGPIVTFLPLTIPGKFPRSASRGEASWLEGGCQLTEGTRGHGRLMPNGWHLRDKHGPAPWQAVPARPRTGSGPTHSCTTHPHTRLEPSGVTATCWWGRQRFQKKKNPF